MAAGPDDGKDPSVGWNGDKSVYLDLYRGECRETRVATEEDIAYVPCVDTVLKPCSKSSEE